MNRGLGGLRIRYVQKYFADFSPSRHIGCFVTRPFWGNWSREVNIADRARFTDRSQRSSPANGRLDLRWLVPVFRFLTAHNFVRIEQKGRAVPL